MRVIILPYDDDTNKYRQGLIQGFEDSDEVEIVPGTWNPVSPLLWSVFGGENRPDVIHIHWLHLFFLGDNFLETALKLVRFPVELATLRLTGTKIVWTVHNLYEHDRELPRLERVYRIMAARAVDGMIVHCSLARELVVDEYRMGRKRESKIHVVPHGNYTEAYENSYTQSQAREELGIPPEERVFLYFGQIRPYKSVPNLIRKFSEAELDESTLLVAGNPDGPELGGRVETLARQTPNVRSALRFIPDEEVQIYFNAADVVVLPYKRILTSGTAVLAISFGRPVVAPSIRCLPDLLEFQSELLYTPSESGTLKDALERADTADLNRLGRRASAEAEKYDWEAIAERTVAVYRENRSVCG